MIAVVNNRRNAQKLHESLGGAARDADGDGVRYDPPTGFDLLSNVPHRGATAARSPPNVSRSRNSSSPADLVPVPGDEPPEDRGM